jgi:hypothetical protein
MPLGADDLADKIADVFTLESTNNSVVLNVGDSDKSTLYIMIAGVEYRLVIARRDPRSLTKRRDLHLPE